MSQTLMKMFIMYYAPYPFYLILLNLVELV